MSSNKKDRIMIDETEGYYPRGEMCLSCTKLFEDCSHLPFQSMYVIEKDGNDNYVRCTFHNNSIPLKD